MSAQAIGTNSGKQDKLFAAEIYRFVREFQHIRIRVTPENVEERVYAFVHPPYMLQSVTLIDNDKQFKQLKERHQARLQRVKEARETAGEAVRGFLDRQFYEDDGWEKHIASGRAELAEIRKLLQEAVDQGLVSLPRGKKHPDGYVLRKWLKTYGVGIDCSGFVQQILKRLIEVSCSDVEKGSSREPRSDIRFLRCQWVYRNITRSSEDHERIFVEVFAPAKARPGDIVVSRSHMRIVANIEVVEDEGIVFELAESTSARDIPSGQTCEETDIGPRIIQVKYTKPNWPIAKQTPLKKRLIDGTFKKDRAESLYIIGRYQEFEQLRSDA